MMTSPARAHFQRASAARIAEAAGPGQSLEGLSQYELMLAMLARHSRRLKQVQSNERKAEVKREVLPEYLPWVQGVLAHGKGAQDDVLMTVMVWRIDAGDYAGALDIGDYALAYRLAMPKRFNRDAATTLTEEMADAAKRARDGGQPFDVALLRRTLALVTGIDTPDQSRSRLLKELGLLLTESDPPAALGYLQQATRLNPAAGVKKQLDKLARQTGSPQAVSTADDDADG